MDCGQRSRGETHNTTSIRCICAHDRERGRHDNFNLNRPRSAVRLRVSVYNRPPSPRPACSHRCHPSSAPTSGSVGLHASYLAACANTQPFSRPSQTPGSSANKPLRHRRGALTATLRFSISLLQSFNSPNLLHPLTHTYSATTQPPFTKSTTALHTTSRFNSTRSTVYGRRTDFHNGHYPPSTASASSRSISSTNCRPAATVHPARPVHSTDIRLWHSLGQVSNLSTHIMEPSSTHAAASHPDSTSQVSPLRACCSPADRKAHSSITPQEWSTYKVWEPRESERWHRTDTNE